LPCRRSWVRVPSSALEIPANADVLSSAPTTPSVEWQGLPEVDRGQWRANRPSTRGRSVRPIVVLRVNCPSPRTAKISDSEHKARGTDHDKSHAGPCKAVECELRTTEDDRERADRERKLEALIPPKRVRRYPEVQELSCRPKGLSVLRVPCSSRDRWWSCGEAREGTPHVRPSWPLFVATPMRS
jgi:hypothetical protein